MPPIKKYNAERRYKALLECAYENIVVYDKNGVILDASPKIKNVIGYSAKELIGRKGREFIHPEDYEQVKQLFRNLKDRHGKTETLISRAKHKKGHYFWTESRLTNQLQHPDICGIISNFKSIQEQKAAEEKLFEAQYLLETINKNLSEGIFMSVIGKKLIYANEAFARLFGFSSAKEFVKIGKRNLFADKKSYEEVMQQLHSDGRVRNIDVLFKKKDGSTFWGRFNARKISFRQYESCAIGSIRDITQ